MVGVVVLLVCVDKFNVCKVSSNDDTYKLLDDVIVDVLVLSADEELALISAFSSVKK